MNSISRILCISVSDRDVSQMSRQESLSENSWKQSRGAGQVCLSNSKISILNSPLTSSISGVINTRVSTTMYTPLYINHIDIFRFKELHLSFSVGLSMPSVDQDLNLMITALSSSEQEVQVSASRQC